MPSRPPLQPPYVTASMIPNPLPESKQEGNIFLSVTAFGAGILKTMHQVYNSQKRYYGGFHEGE